MYAVCICFRTGALFVMVMYQNLSNMIVLESIIQDRAIFMQVFIFVTFFLFKDKCLSYQLFYVKLVTEETVSVN